jgi:hypothetical protein
LGDDEDGEEVSFGFVKDVVAVWAQFHRRGKQASFFAELAQRTGFQCLTKVQAPARCCPSSSAMRTLAFSEEHKPISNNEHTNADLREV